MVKLVRLFFVVLNKTFLCGEIFITFTQFIPQQNYLPNPVRIFPAQ